MTKGPLGGPRPFAQDEMGIFLSAEPSEFSNIDRFIDNNKSRLENELSFSVEDEISGEFSRFSVDNVDILFSKDRIGFRVETAEESISGHQFNMVMNTIVKVLEKETEGEDENINVALNFLPDEWMIGKGLRGW